MTNNRIKSVKWFASNGVGLNSELFYQDRRIVNIFRTGDKKLFRLQFENGSGDYVNQWVKLESRKIVKK